MQADTVVLIIDRKTLNSLAHRTREDELPTFWAAIDNAVSVDEVATVYKAESGALAFYNGDGFRLPRKETP